MNRKRLKLCIVLPAHWEAVMGGSQYQAKMLVEYLVSKDKYDIYYLARKVTKTFTPDGYVIKQIISPSLIGRYGEFMDAISLISILKQISPDVIYQRVGCGYTGIVAFYAKRYKKKCVWHVSHDREVRPFDKKITRNIIFRYIDKKFLEYGVLNVNSIITQTRQQADYLWANYRREKAAVIPNVQPWPMRPIIKNTLIKVVWVANLKSWKHPEIFIQLAKDLGDIQDVQFIMIGKPIGSPKWCKKIQNDAEQLNNINFLGGRSQDFVNNTLSNAHIFVNTSIDEGFANTFIQSWMRKVPVVSLYVNPDGVFDDERVGIFAKGDYMQLKESVVRLIKDEELRNTIGERAQTYAKMKHSTDKLKNLTEIIFQ